MFVEQFSGIIEVDCLFISTGIADARRRGGDPLRGATDDRRRLPGRDRAPVRRTAGQAATTAVTVARPRRRRANAAPTARNHRVRTVRPWVLDACSPLLFSFRIFLKLSTIANTMLRPSQCSETTFHVFCREMAIDDKTLDIDNCFFSSVPRVGERFIG